MGWCTTFEIFEFIRETDTTEPYIEARYIVVRYIIANWIAAADQMQQLRQRIRQKHTIILYYYSIF